jgi:leucyl/phenylalanyl-tRNA--protein transferase
MFHRVTDASKVALVVLVDRLRTRGFALLDIQWVTPHLAGFGAVSIPRRRYLRLLEQALALRCDFGSPMTPVSVRPARKTGEGSLDSDENFR